MRCCAVANPGAVVPVPISDSTLLAVHPLAAYVGAALALAVAVALLRRLGGRIAVARREPARARVPVSSWRGAAALLTAIAAGAVLVPMLVALRQIYALPGAGGRLAALVLMLLLLVAAAILAVLFADPGEDR